MKYQKIIIKNFKGIEFLELDLGKRTHSNVIALVGLNESGKTTILEAIDWFYQPTNYNVHDLMPKHKRANFNGSLSVTSVFETSEKDEVEIASFLEKQGWLLITPVKNIKIQKEYQYLDSEKVEENSFWTIELKGKKKRGTKLYSIHGEDKDVWQETITYIKKEMLPPAVYYENFLFDFPDKIYLEEDISAVENNSFYRSVLQDVLNSLNRNLRIEKHLLDRYTSGKRKDKDNIEAVLDEASAKVSEIIISAWSEILKSGENRLFISLGNTIEKDELGHFIQIKVREDNHSYYIRERSLGFRWFFSFTLFTYFRTFRDNQRENALFLLDEPASNLHSAAQTKLLSEFEKVTKNQTIIYSTHSHHLINPKWLSGTFVVKNEAMTYGDLNISYSTDQTRIRAESYYQFAAAHPKQDDYYRPILDALDVQPGPLEYIPELVMLEGRNDYYTLRYMKDLGYVDTTTDHYLYPGAGKDKMAHFVALYLAWGRNFIVFLDDDDGKKTAKRLKKEFGIAVENRVFTFADVDSNWKGYEMEDLFAHSDPLKVIKILQPAQDDFNKSWFNKSIEKCWQEDIKVGLTKVTIKRFEKLYSFIEKKIEEGRVLKK